jgi:U3 small nucleolar ribonucleoprotein protein IMP4
VTTQNKRSENGLMYRNSTQTGDRRRTNMAVRREIRLRKEYLLKKQKEVKEVVVSDKKRKLKDAVEEGKSIPTEFVNEARKLYHDMELDITPAPGSIDDEYANAGVKEPKICVTTSRDPSSRLKQFAK